MSSATYGDSSGRPPTTSIYTHHVDSRNREALLTSTPSTYTVKLSDELVRVRTIQVGDVQLPTDARNAIDYARRHFQVSEPMNLASATTLTIQETSRTYNRQSGALLSTSAPTSHSISFPATLNAVTGVVDNVITLEDDHHLDSVIAYWPSTAPASVFAGTRIINMDANVSSATLDSANPFPATNELTLDSTYVTTVLAPNTVGLATLNQMMVGTNANATLYVTPLTVPEWVAVLDEALADMQGPAKLSQRYRMTINESTGLVELRVVNGDKLTYSTRTEVDARFTVVEGDVMWRLGFPAGTWPLRAYKSERLDETGAHVDASPYVMAVVPREARTIQLRRGRYASASDLAAELTRATSSLFLQNTLTSGPRKLWFTDGTSAMRSVLVPYGRYSPAQLALFLQTNMNAAPSVGAAFVVTANDAAHHGGGAFTIADAYDRPFSLDFSSAEVAPLASALGFETVLLSGASSYTSTREAYCGQSTATSDVDMARLVTWGVDASGAVLRAVSSQPVGLCDAFLGDEVTLNTNVYTTNFFALGSGSLLGTVPSGTPVAIHLGAYDLVRFSCNSQSVLALSLAGATGDQTTSPINTATISFGAIVLGDDIDITNVDTEHRMHAATVARPDFVLHMVPLPPDVRATEEDTTGAALYNATLPDAARNVGNGTAYGPVAEQLGFLPTTMTSSCGVVIAPGVFSLDPPPYVLLALVSPTFVSERALFRPTRTTEVRAVLAKFIVSHGYARITEESTHVTTTSALNFGKITVAWLNPDGTLVDWNGANHSFSLLFRVFEGHVSGVGVH